MDSNKSQSSRPMCSFKNFIWISSQNSQESKEKKKNILAQVFSPVMFVKSKQLYLEPLWTAVTKSSVLSAIVEAFL